MTALELLDHLFELNVSLWVEEGSLRYRAPKGVLTPTLMELLKQHKTELIALLERKSTNSPSFNQIEPDIKGKYEPFPLTDLQQAYWIGRNASFSLGNIAAHFYVEIDVRDLDLANFSRAWQKLIQHHDMLRVVILPDGQQQILKDIPDYQIAVVDLQNKDKELVGQELANIKKHLSHQMLQTDRWPLFEMRASLLDAHKTRLHISFDLLVGDAWSFRILMLDLARLYEDPNSSLVPLKISFRDYVLAELSFRNSPAYKRAQEYWRNRLSSLPPPPDLPMVKTPHNLSRPQFSRFSGSLTPDQWTNLKKKAAQIKVTPPGILLAIFSQVLMAWSRNSRFTINLTLFNRLPFHPQVNQLVGDFSATLLLAVTGGLPNFSDFAKAIQNQLWEDLEHSYVSGVQVLRELAHKTGQMGMVMPVVFTSALFTSALSGSIGANFDYKLFKSIEKSKGVSQTPQVWLDHQVTEQGGRLSFNWDVIEELFPEGMITEIFNSYCTLLNTLADSADSWETTIDLLPEKERNQHQEINQTEKALVPQLLHEIFSQTAQNLPAQLAIITPEGSWTYHELDTITNQLGNYLRNAGAIPNQLVAIVMEKGWEQVVAALGILKAGAAYLPIEATLPPERIGELLKLGKVAHALIQAKTTVSPLWPSDITYQVVASVELANHSPKPLSSHQSVSDLAYVIFTSGSTGTPKGVMIDHIGAHNTIVDINERFGVHPQDRVFALSSLSFDLSVYDLFGSLAVGATLVIPEASSSKDPAHWVEMVDTHKVTIWNSVPALMQMLVEYVEGQKSSHLASLRLIMMSGDWIPVSLPDRIKALIKDITVISLGGATEASIWSIIYPIGTVDKQWKSIPYGKPMVNQQFYVLNQALQQTPNWVVGELYIGGIGLAKGYWQDPIKTAEKFIETPTGQRLYRTGDLGRYLADGNIEFLGREDFQVKIQGYRIELGEIEAVLEQCPGVKTGVVAAIGEDRHNRKLVGYIVAEQADLDLSVVKAYLQQRLPDYMVPTVFSLIDTLPLSSNGKVDRNRLVMPESITTTSTEVIAPRDELELRIAKIWEKILNITAISVTDNFYNLGGNSLQAIQLMVKMDQELGVRIPIAQLLRDGTIEKVAEFFKAKLATPPVTTGASLVEFTPGKEKPLFFVHPVGGTVFCYQELATQLGSSQPFYGLQSCSLGGKKDYFADIESMAAYYLSEIVTIDPNGPYLLGGWSMGGVIAYEMACQLKAQGRPVELVIMLDAGKYPPVGSNEVLSLVLFAQYLTGLFLREIFIDTIWLKDLSLKERLEWLFTKLSQANSLPSSLDLAGFQELFQLFQTNMQALEKYIPPAYEGNILTIDVDSGKNDEIKILPWAEVIKGKWEKHLFSGDHYSLIQSPQIGKVVNIINNILHNSEH